MAYLAYLTYDEEFNLIEDASGIIHANDDNTVNNIGILDLVIPKNGYIYIYVANESPTNVYFDNLQIQHKKSNVLELNDYFPYGLLNTQNSQTGLSLTPDNLHKFQDKEMQNALDLNTLDFGLRHYDATLGRWHVQDPMMQFMNAYLAMNNNPVITIDPTGGQGFVGNSGKAPTMNEMNGNEYYTGPHGVDMPDAFSQRGSAWVYERDANGNLVKAKDKDGHGIYNENYVAQMMSTLTGTNHYGVSASGVSNAGFFGGWQDVRNDIEPGVSISYNGHDNTFEKSKPVDDFIGPINGITLLTTDVEDLKSKPYKIQEYAYNNYDIYGMVSNEHAVGVGIGFNLGFGLFYQGIQISVGIFGQGHGKAGQIFISGGIPSSPVFLDFSMSTQLLVGQSKGNTFDLSGASNNWGLGYGNISASWIQGIDDNGNVLNNIFGVGPSVGSKYSMGPVNSKTTTIPWVWPRLWKAVGGRF